MTAKRVGMPKAGAYRVATIKGRGGSDWGLYLEHKTERETQFRIAADKRVSGKANFVVLFDNDQQAHKPGRDFEPLKRRRPELRKAYCEWLKTSLGLESADIGMKQKADVREQDGKGVASKGMIGKVPLDPAFQLERTILDEDRNEWQLYLKRKTGKSRWDVAKVIALERQTRKANFELTYCREERRFGNTESVRIMQSYRQELWKQCSAIIIQEASK